MGSDISGEGSNDNTIEQNLQGAKKNLLLLKPLKTAMDLCCIISLWRFQMQFKLEYTLKMAILHSHKRKAPCIYSIGPESS